MPVILNGGPTTAHEVLTSLRCHSLMPVILNGGFLFLWFEVYACVPLVDACDTEWRPYAVGDGEDADIQCHSLMPVILNGGGGP